MRGWAAHLPRRISAFLAEVTDFHRLQVEAAKSQEALELHATDRGLSLSAPWQADRELGSGMAAYAVCCCRTATFSMARRPRGEWYPHAFLEVSATEHNVAYTKNMISQAQSFCLKLSMYEKEFR